VEIRRIDASRQQILPQLLRIAIELLELARELPHVVVGESAAVVRAVGTRVTAVGAILRRTVVDAAALAALLRLLPVLLALALLLILLALLLLLILSILLTLLAGALLLLLAITRLLILIRAIAQPLIERLHAAHEVARLVGRLRQRILLRLVAEGVLRVGDLLFERVEIRPDILFHPRRGLRRGALQHAPRIADLFPHAFVADA